MGFTLCRTGTMRYRFRHRYYQQTPLRHNSPPTRTSFTLPTLLPYCFKVDTQHQLHPKTLPFLLRHTLTYATHKDSPKDSTKVAWWLKQPHSESSIREPFLETRTTKTWVVLSIRSPKNYKGASVIKTHLIPPTIIHSNRSTCLRS